jgi:hypothetical protein
MTIKLVSKSIIKMKMPNNDEKFPSLGKKGVGNIAYNSMSYLRIPLYNNFLILYVFLVLLASCSKQSVETGTEKVDLPKEVFLKKDALLSVLDDSLITEGYFNKFSFDQDERASIYLNAKTARENANLGIYDIEGNLVDYFTATISPQAGNQDKSYENGYGYKSSGYYGVPQNLKSGVYFVGKKIPFLVKNSVNLKSKILIVYPSNTDIAYNLQGGKSYYHPTVASRARTLSILRPWSLEQSFAEPFYIWLLHSSYKADFISDVEMDDYANIKDYKLIIIPGHSEYWTRSARTNFDRFNDEGNDILLLSGNTMWWQVRYNEDKTQMTCYKYDVQNDAEPNTLLKTGCWDDISLHFPLLSSLGSTFRFGGRMNTSAGSFGGYKISKPNSPLFKGTNLKFGDLLTFSCHELDGTPVKFRIINEITKDSIPEFDNSTAAFYKSEVIGYEFVVADDYPQSKATNVSAFNLIQKKSSSGRIINFESTDWCKNAFSSTNPTSKNAIVITTNAINLLLLKQNIFTD